MVVGDFGFGEGDQFWVMEVVFFWVWMRKCSGGNWFNDACVSVVG